MQLFDALTWATPDACGTKVVLSVRVGHQLVKVGIVAHEARAGVLTHPLVLEVPTGLQHKQQSSQFTGTITEPRTNDNTAFLERSLGKILSEPRHGARADAATRGAARRKINQNSDVSPVLRPTTSEAAFMSEGFVSLAAAHPDLKRRRERLKCEQPRAPSPPCAPWIVSLLSQPTGRSRVLTRQSVARGPVQPAAQCSLQQSLGEGPLHLLEHCWAQFSFVTASRSTSHCSHWQQAFVSHCRFLWGKKKSQMKY